MSEQIKLRAYNEAVAREPARSYNEDISFMEGVLAEAARNEQAQLSKDRELIQTLVNVLAKTTKWAHSAGRERFMWTEEEAERAMSDEVAALALAGEQGYQPTEG